MIDSDTLASRGFVVAPGLIGPAECRALAACGPKSRASAAMSSCSGTATARANTSISPIRCPSGSRRCARRSIPSSPPWPTAGTSELGIAKRFPPSLQGWLRQCHAGGQKRPTPLLLRYGPGDYNCLHRDLYGELVFPLQATVLLSDPAKDFSGGEFMLVEQRPRMQSRGEVVPLKQGDAVIFAVNERPVKGSRGFYRTAMRHGVSSLREGERFTLGIIFHDAA